MTKVVLAVAALVAAAGTVASTAVTSTVPEFLPLQNPGTELCIVKGEFNEEGEYFKLALGECDDKDVVEVRHVGKEKELRDCDNFCVATVERKSREADVELVLSECPDKVKGFKGAQWTQVGVNQWKNGNDLCMSYKNETETFVQGECETLEDDDKTSFEQYKFLAPAMVGCVDWTKSWYCAKGWALNPAVTCVGSTGSECASVCCAPAKTCQSEGCTTCPNGYKFVNKECGNYGQKPCDWEVCCEPITTCMSAGYANKCPVDYKFADRECGNPGQKPCSWETCCDYNPQPIKCGQWNRCSNGWTLKPRSNDIWCTRGKPVEGAHYAPTCSNEICCDQTVKETTCGRWNNCDAGYELKPNVYNKRCWEQIAGVMPLHHNGGSEWCSNSACCQEKAEPTKPSQLIGCDQWTGSCKGDGVVLRYNPEFFACEANAGASANPSCLERCCVQDTCEQWTQRIVETAPVELTGEEVCINDPAFTGAMTSSDPLFKKPCMKLGRFATCEKSMCCVA